MAIRIDVGFEEKGLVTPEITIVMGELTNMAFVIEVISNRLLFFTMDLVPRPSIYAVRLILSRLKSEEN